MYSSNGFLSIAEDYISGTPGYEILFPIMGGVIIAWLIYVILSASYGKFIKSLKSQNAEDNNSAKSFAELGVKPNLLLKNSLRKEGNGLRRCIDMTEDGKYYITPEKQSKAFWDNHNSSWAAILLQFLAIVVLCLILMKAIPLIVEYFSDPSHFRSEKDFY